MRIDMRNAPADIGREHIFLVAEQLAARRDIGPHPQHFAAERIDALQLILLLEHDAARRHRTAASNAEPTAPVIRLRPDQV